MVRTKTQPRSHTGGKPPTKPLKAKVQVPNNVVFSDHTGKQALMSWPGHGEGDNLPPLGSWAFYMVHPDVTPEFDGVRFQQELDNAQDMHRGSNFRFEFFFLPGATVEECHAHYLGEMRARGTIWRQIRKVKKIMVPRREQMKKERRKLEGEEWNEEDLSEDAYEDETDDHDDAGEQLPGLVWPKYESETATESVGYRGWFFFYPDADLSLKGETGLNRDIYLVRFAPVPHPEGESFTFNPMDHPVHAQKMKARDAEYADHGIWGWIYNRMNSVWEREANEATGDAIELGWKSW